MQNHNTPPGYQHQQQQQQGYPQQQQGYPQQQQGYPQQQQGYQHHQGVPANPMLQNHNQVPNVGNDAFGPSVMQHDNHAIHLPETPAPKQELTLPTPAAKAKAVVADNGNSIHYEHVDVDETLDVSSLVNAVSIMRSISEEYNMDIVFLKAEVNRYIHAHGADLRNAWMGHMYETELAAIKDTQPAAYHVINAMLKDDYNTVLKHVLQLPVTMADGYVEDIDELTEYLENKGEMERFVDASEAYSASYVLAVSDCVIGKREVALLTRTDTVLMAFVDVEDLTNLTPAECTIENTPRLLQMMRAIERIHGDTNVAVPTLVVSKEGGCVRYISTHSKSLKTRKLTVLEVIKA